jgi:hypothetical protein
MCPSLKSSRSRRILARNFGLDQSWPGGFRGLASYCDCAVAWMRMIGFAPKSDHATVSREQSCFAPTLSLSYG